MTVVDLHPEDLLDREARGELGAAELERLERHVAQCKPCLLERQARADFRLEDGGGPEVDVQRLLSDVFTPGASRARTHDVQRSRPAGRRLRPAVLIAATLLVATASAAAGWRGLRSAGAHDAPSPAVAILAAAASRPRSGSSRVPGGSPRCRASRDYRRCHCAIAGSSTGDDGAAPDCRHPGREPTRLDADDCADAFCGAAPCHGRRSRRRAADRAPRRRRRGSVRSRQSRPALGGPCARERCLPCSRRAVSGVGGSSRVAGGPRSLAPRRRPGECRAPILRRVPPHRGRPGGGRHGGPRPGARQARKSP